MNIPKLLLVGCVALTGALLAPSAQARDHGRDRDDRDRHEFRRDYHQHGNFNRPYYYSDRRRPVVYYNEAYYTEPSPSITIAIGGHRRHHWHR